MSSPAPAAADRLGFKPELTCALAVKDYGRARLWYREVLGFEVSYESPDGTWGVLRTPVPGVSVVLSETEDPPVRGGATPTFEVHSVDRARAELERHAVGFDGPSRSIEGVVRLATFFDPDGNAYMLAESLAPDA